MDSNTYSTPQPASPSAATRPGTPPSMWPGSRSDTAPARRPGTAPGSRPPSRPGLRPDDQTGWTAWLTPFGPSGSLAAVAAGPPGRPRAGRAGRGAAGADQGLQAVEGMIALEGRLEPEAGQTLLAALAPLARPHRATDTRRGLSRLTRTHFRCPPCQATGWGPNPRTTKPGRPMGPEHSPPYGARRADGGTNTPGHQARRVHGA
jgi:hypothetical protein